MRNIYKIISFVVLFVGVVFSGIAQPQFYNKNNSTAFNSIPLASNTTNKLQGVYSPGTFGSLGTGNGTPAGAGLITSIYVRLNGATANATYTNFTVRLGQVMGTDTFFPSNAYKAPMTTCYGPTTHTLTGVVSGSWYQIALANSFVYDPTKSLIVEIEQQAYTGTTASMYMNTAASANNQRIYGIYNGTTGTLANGQYDLGIDVAALPACTNPPTAGTVTASTKAICAGQSFNLNLVGGTVGSTQTYQWESSSDSITWTPISGETNTFAILTQLATTYYRCAITCGTTAYSNAVKIYSPSTPLNGTYTINKALATGGTNFNSFNDLALELNCVGVSGPVTVNVVAGSGPYIEQVRFLQATGVNGTNTITINGNGEMISYKPSIDNYIVALDGADYMILDNLHIVDSATTTGIGVSISNSANRNIVRNCTIDFPVSTSTATTIGGICMTGAIGATATVGFTGNQNKILNNTINGSTAGGPYIGISFYGLADLSGNNGNEIKGNIIKDFYFYGLYIYYSVNMVVEGNDLSRPTKTSLTTGYGAAIINLNPNLKFVKNKIHNLFDTNPISTSAAYPLYFSTAKGYPGQEILVANNLVYNINNNGTVYGTYLSGAKNINIYHNTFNYDMGTAGTLYGYYFVSAPDSINLKNNILKISRSGTAARYGYYMSATPTVWTSDNNDITVDAGTGSGTAAVGYISAAARTTLADWQLASLRDAASVSVLPVFADPANGDLKPGAAATNNSGTDLLAIVADDIYGVARTTTPDMGAIEYTPLNNDAGVLAIQNGICPTPDSIFVKVKNYGIDPLTSVKVYASVNGTPTPNNGNTFAINVLPGLDTLLNMGVYTFGAGTTPTITAYTTLPNNASDANLTNDTLVKTFSLGLSGNYTINSALATSGTNFQSLTDVENSLNTYGICGPVVFDVVVGSGPYVNQQVNLGEIVGSSAVNTITINGHNETTSFLSTNTNQRAQFLLSGTDYVTIDSFVIVAQATSSSQYGFGIHLISEANYNNIIGNKIYLDSTLNSSTLAGIAISAASNSATLSGTLTGNYNLIKGNFISGGYYGITLMGTNTTVHKIGNTVMDNEVRNYFYYGVYCYYQDSAKVINNIIKGGSNATYSTSVPSTQYGAYIYYNNYPTVLKNKIELNATTTQYGLYSYYNYGLPGTPILFANNFVSCLAATGTVYGLYAYNCKDADYIHNSVFVNGGSATAGRGVYLNSSTSGYNNIRLYNNIAVNTGPGYAIEISNAAHTAGYVSAMDYNNWYGNTTNPFRYNNANYTTIAAWRTASGKDANSMAFNPQFVSPTNLHIAANILNDKGLVGLGVNEDIDGEVRCPNAGCAGSTLKPDIGADEFLGVPILVDIKVVHIDSAMYKSCYTNAEPVKVKIKNVSSTTLDFTTNPVTIYASVSGAVSNTFTPIVISADSLLPDSSMLVTISTAFDMSTPGVYNFTIYSSEPTDGNLLNDTLRTSVTYSIGTINNTYAQICSGSSFELKINNKPAGASIVWQKYDATAMTWVDETAAGSDSVAYSVLVSANAIYRAKVCGANYSDNDTLEPVLVPNPIAQGDTICGSGTAQLITPSIAGIQNVWFANDTSATPIYLGDTLNISVSGDSTVYVQATKSLLGGSGLLKITKIDVGTNDGIEIQNLSNQAINTTGWKVAVSNSYTNINLVNANLWSLPTSIPSGQMSFKTDQTGGANYWGSNILWNPGAYSTYTGWAMIIDASGNIVDAVFLNWPATVIATMNTTINGFPITITDEWVGDGINQAAVPQGNFIARIGNSDNNTAANFNQQTTPYLTQNVGLNIPFIGGGCESNRVPVAIKVNPLPIVNLGADTAVCSPNTVVLDAANAGATYMWTDMSTAQTLTASATGTYGVLVTDANGCKGADTIAVTVNALPVVNLGNDTAVCSPNTVVLDAANAGSTYMWTDMSTAQTLTASATGTYGVLVTDANGCMGADTVMVTVNTPPTVSLGNDTAVCSPNTVMLDAGNAGVMFMWSDMSTGQTLTASATGTYGVLVTDANGCMGADTVMVTVNALPVVSLGNDTAVCSPNTVMLDAGNAGAMFMWTDMSTAQTLTASATGTYGVLVTDANGCMGADTVMVTVNTPPTVSLGNDTAVCSPNTVILDAGNAGAMFMWTDMSTAQTLTASATGTYGVLVTDANGCMGADTVMVTVNALPVVNLGADITQCGGTATLDAGNAGATYMWTDMTTAQTLTASATGTYGVLVKDANGCVGADTVNVTINTLPTVSLGNDTAVCAPNTVMLDAGNAGATYAWSNAATTQTTVITASGTYSVVVTAPNSCTATDAVVVTVNALPVVNLGADISQCGGTATLDAGNAGSTYAWSNAAATQTTVVSTTGTYSVEVTTGAGCKGTDTVNVTIKTVPTVSFSLSADTTCVNGGLIALTGTPTGGTFSGTGVSGANFDPATSGAGTFTVTYSVTDATSNCTGTASDVIVVNSICAGIEDLVKIAATIYPTPTTGSINIKGIETNKSSVEAKVYDMQGKVVMINTLAATSANYQMNVSELAAGVYTISITTEIGNYIGRFVKE